MSMRECDASNSCPRLYTFKHIHTCKKRASLFSRGKGRTWILQTDVSLIDYMRNELTEPRWLDALA